MAQFDTGIGSAGTGTGKKPVKKSKKKKVTFMGIIKGIFPVKGDSLSEIIRKIVFLISFIVLIVSGAVIAKHYFTYNIEAEIRQQGMLELKNRTPTDDEIIDMPKGAVNEKFAALHAINNDFVGWLTVPSTNIDFEVLQTTDNDYYLTHDFNHKKTDIGAIFIDYEKPYTADSHPANTIIYGHNLYTQHRFSALRNYKPASIIGDANLGLDFLKQVPTIQFDTLYGDGKYKIFSVFIANTKEEHGAVFNYHHTVSFDNKTEFKDYVSEAMDRSFYNTGVDVKYGDDLLTLSTCDTTIDADLRLVIMARKVRDGESPSVNPEQIVEKTSYKTFEMWSKRFKIEYTDPTYDPSQIIDE